MKALSRTFIAIAGLLGASLSLQAHAHDDQPHGTQGYGDGMPPMFEKFDTNKDGKLSKDEVRAGVDKAFAEADTDKDGSISREEMRAHHKAMHAQMQERWRAYDKDGDGALSRAEVDAAGMKMLSRDFDKFDKNKDRKLTPDEIREGMMMRRQGGMPGAPATPSK